MNGSYKEVHLSSTTPVLFFTIKAVCRRKGLVMKEWASCLYKDPRTVYVASGSGAWRSTGLSQDGVARLDDWLPGSFPNMILSRPLPTVRTRAEDDKHVCRAIAPDVSSLKPYPTSLRQPSLCHVTLKLCNNKKSKKPMSSTSDPKPLVLSGKSVRDF